MELESPSCLSDAALVAAVARLARSERETTAALIAHLAELYARRLHESAGYASLFTYCTEALQLSDGAAYDRMKAAKVARRFPAVLGRLAIGELNLTSIRLLAPHLTPANAEELFAAARGLRKRQVLELLARRFPVPDVAPSVRKLPARAAPVSATPAVSNTPSAPVVQSGAPAQSGSNDPAAIPSAPRPPVRPLALERYQITFTADAETRDMLELAQDLLRHAIPGAEPAQVVARALKLLVAELVRQKYAVTGRPRANRGQAADSRNIPAEVKRAVFIRDRGRCAFVGSGGHRCGARGFIEFHHVQPYAVGGLPTADNIELLCGVHNRYEAGVFYGPGKRYAAGVGVATEPTASCDVTVRDIFVPERKRVGPDTAEVPMT